MRQNSPDLNTTDACHLILEFRLKPEHCLPEHGPRGPVIAAANDTFHATLGAGHEEAHWRALSKKEGCCHVAYSTLATHSQQYLELELTSINKSEKALVAGPSRFCLLYYCSDRRVRRGVIANALAMFVAMMPG